MHIKDQAARAPWSWPHEKLFSRSEEFRSPARVHDEELERLTYGNIVIDDEDDRFEKRHAALSHAWDRGDPYG